MLTLWLMPDGEAYNLLQELILDLSQTHDTPRFEPHITLLSGITDEEDLAIEKTRHFAFNTQPITAALTHIEYLELYYRCLFFRADTSEQLMQARQQAEQLFEHTQIQPFIPHVSFLYGAMPTFQKEAIINDLGNRFLMSLKMNMLRLVRTQRTPEYWELVAEFPLGKSQKTSPLIQ